MSHAPDPPEVQERFDASLHLVDVIARQVFAATGASYAQLEDLVSFGREGLLLASRRFDPSRGVPFLAYAHFRIRGAMVDGVRTMAPLPRRAHQRLKALRAANLCSEGAAEDAFAAPPTSGTPADAEHALTEHLANMATAMAIGLVGHRAYDDSGQLTIADSTLDPEESFKQAELLRVVTEQLQALPPQEAELIRRHYLQGDRFDQVASDLGLSKSWASRLHTRAIARLTAHFRSKDER